MPVHRPCPESGQVRILLGVRSRHRACRSVLHRSVQAPRALPQPHACAGTPRRLRRREQRVLGGPARQRVVVPARPRHPRGAVRPVPLLPRADRPALPPGGRHARPGAAEPRRERQRPLAALPGSYLCRRQHAHAALPCLGGVRGEPARRRGGPPARALRARARGGRLLRVLRLPQLPAGHLLPHPWRLRPPRRPRGEAPRVGHRPPAHRLLVLRQLVVARVGPERLLPDPPRHQRVRDRDDARGGPPETRRHPRRRGGGALR
mmetsp:Transcript_20503/g.57419  ORF Transcript_20503/g.57419 Transcript_20503/m.57419 type:complete len:263 (+) Transcript_20503:1519-2307(+)